MHEFHRNYTAILFLFFGAIQPFCFIVYKHENYIIYPKLYINHLPTLMCMAASSIHEI